MGQGESAEQKAKAYEDKLRTLPKYSLEEVSRHNKETDAWIVVDGQVLDITKFLTNHPGGKDILMSVAGTDATSRFEKEEHSQDARLELRTLCIGRLAKTRTHSATASTTSTTSTSSSTSSATSTSNASAPSTSTTSSTSSATSSTTNTSSSTAPTTAVTEESSGCGGNCTCTTEPKVTIHLEEQKTPAPYSAVNILYASNKGACQGFAERIQAAILEAKLPLSTNLQVMEEFEPEDLALPQFVVLVISTYEGGTPPTNGKFMYEWMEDASVDFRVGPTFLCQGRFAIFGVGDSLYEDKYNVVSKNMETWIQAMGGPLICDRGEGDNSVSRDAAGDASSDLKAWVEGKLLAGLRVPWNSAVYRAKPAQPDPVIEEDEYEYDDGAPIGNLAKTVMGEDHSQVLDVEELGPVIRTQKEQQKREYEDRKSGVAREMVNDVIRQNLTKQGYKIIGSHSGVKLCRWTKAMLRGRGGCYKHTFYGIASYQCMEMTPSLACANKCVFCWRHHTNPVGKEWKWASDPPEFLVEEAVSKHKQMIKQMKGVPGVKPERFQEASTSIRHCALSLVGEPIMYPQINAYLALLHERNISTFLVTNAQFPDRIEILEPVTQLYISVDAATKDELKAIDRPLFSDFWERFIASMKALSQKQQRTVYRMTLVKGMNMGQMKEYARLIALGNPTFIEIKGVTFCGDLNASDITMKNVPFHQEVRDFSRALCEEIGLLGQGGPTYELACEHVHSCCILISDTRLKINGKWHTWIDYPKFHQLFAEYAETGKMFDTLEYAAPTPDWAVFGAEQEGFDPEETRWHRKEGKVVDKYVDPEPPSESSCS